MCDSYCTSTTRKSLKIKYFISLTCEPDPVSFRWFRAAFGFEVRVFTCFDPFLTLFFFGGRIEKIYSDSNFWAWVPFHEAILKYC